MTPAEILAMVDELRGRGATLVEVTPEGAVKAAFGPPPPYRVPLEPAAALEKAERQKAREARSEEDRLFTSIGIRPRDDAA